MDAKIRNHILQMASYSYDLELIRTCPDLMEDGEHVSMVHVHNYLKRYGYLSLEAKFEANRMDAATVKALRKFQEFFGLGVSGILDAPTRERMSSARCGMPDHLPVEFNTIGAWARRSLRYAFGVLSTQVTNDVARNSVRRAFATWQSAGVGLTFTEVSLANNPDIIVEWRPAADPDHSMVGGVLAHADFPPGFSVIVAQPPLPLHFDDTEHTWVDGAVNNGFDIETVSLHELGHCLGLLHTSVAGSVMFPTVSANFTRRTLQTDDAEGIHSLYGSLSNVVVRRSVGGSFSGNESWTGGPYFGSRDTFFADVTGDGRADAIVVNNDRITVRRSTGSSFSGNEDWTSGPFFGSRGTFFADVTGDGKADAIVVNNDRITVRRSTGSGFGAPEDWTGGAYFGSRGTFFADVTGDGKADAIVVNNDRITVRRSTGSGFGAPEDWTGGAYFGSRGTFFADVTGDGKADAIVVNNDRITVRRSTGSGFGAPEDWTGGAYFGSRGTFFADVTGDGKADAIVVNNDRITVRRSTGSGFGAPEDWTGGAYFGSRGTFFADVTGDGKADAIVSNG